jgi:hypothetical protein
LHVPLDDLTRPQALAMRSNAGVICRGGGERDRLIG